MDAAVLILRWSVHAHEAPTRRYVQSAGGIRPRTPPSGTTRSTSVLLPARLGGPLAYLPIYDAAASIRRPRGLHSSIRQSVAGGCDISANKRE